MKVEQGKPDFKSVTITLETQDEVNQLFGLLNYGPVSRSLPITNELFRQLQPFKTNYDKHFNKVRKVLEKLGDQ